MLKNLDISELISYNKVITKKREERFYGLQREKNKGNDKVI